MNILIADDMEQIANILAGYAEKEGFKVFKAFDGQEAIELFEKVKFDMILLDVMMPKKDGFEVCKEIRKKSSVPVIMITARGEDYDKIMGLDIGADDYIVKPFSPAEVMARIRSILRRTSPNLKKNVIEFSGLKIELDSMLVSVEGKNIPVTKKEFELLLLFVNSPGQVFTREQLLDNIWGIDYDGDSRTVDAHIKRLRAKLEAVPHQGWDITTIWGTGYKFETQNSN